MNMKYQKIAALAAAAAAAAVMLGAHAVGAAPLPAGETGTTAAENGQQILPSAAGRSERSMMNDGQRGDNGMTPGSGESGTSGGSMGGDTGGAMNGAMEGESGMLSDVTDGLMSGDGSLGDTDDRDGSVDGTSDDKTGSETGDGTDTAQSSSGTTGDDGMSIWGIVIVLGVIAAAVILLFALMPKRKNGA